MKIEVSFAALVPTCAIYVRRFTFRMVWFYLRRTSSKNIYRFIYTKIPSSLIKYAQNVEGSERIWFIYDERRVIYDELFATNAYCILKSGNFKFNKNSSNSICTLICFQGQKK